MLNKTKCTIAILLSAIIAIAAVSTAAYTLAQTTSPSPSPSMPPSQTTSNATSLNATAIAQVLGTPVVITNNQSGVVTAVLVRQSPQIKINATVVNNFTLANSVVEFWAAPNATSNGTVYARGFFGLTENEVNPVIYQAVMYNWTLLNLHPYMVGDEPKLQFLHWQTWGNLTTILNQVRNVTALTTIGRMNTTVPPMQTALNATFIGKQLNGTVINGAVVDIMIPRMDVNVTATVNGTKIVLNTFASMMTSFEFAPANMTTGNATNMVNATSGNVMVMGDFALRDSEVAAVQKALLNQTATNSTTMTNVTITAIHDHMLNETPKMTFLHFSATGDLTQIISLLNNALNQTTIRGNMTTTTMPSNTPTPSGTVRP